MTTLPFGARFFCYVPNGTTAEEIADFITGQGVPITADCIQIKESDMRYASAQISMPWETMAAAMSYLMSAAQFKGMPLEFRCRTIKAQKRFQRQCRDIRK